VNIVGSRHFFV